LTARKAAKATAPAGGAGARGTGEAGSGRARNADLGRLFGRLIAVGVTGSIAAYKAAELVRRLRDEGADVVVLMTSSATRFVGELTFAALTRHAVETDVGGLLADQRIGHIVVADTVDAIVVAPATAHWLAAMATGLAGDVVTAACLASSAPVIVAPAMDGEMYDHPATRSNVARLRDDFGYTIVEPERGSLASGQTGQGRLAETSSIVDAVVATIGADLAEQVRAATLAIYKYAADYAAQRGILIADTKLEFGTDENGRLLVMDEMLTPDSSRFWPADTYAVGTSPPSYDKQFVRDYLETLDWNKTAPGPHVPAEVIEGTRAKYAEALQRLAGIVLE